MSAPPRIVAIVPAAGRSRRMGADKQLLDVKGRPMLLAVVESLAAAEVDGVIVVTRTPIAHALPSPSPTNVTVLCPEPECPEMIDSIRAGIAECQARGGLDAGAGVLVCPADQPGITTADVEACLAAFRAAPQCIIIATHAGRRGHPIIFPAGLVDFVRSAACGAGLNALPHSFADRVLHVECASPGVATDVDTRGDLADPA
jgi:molybdenum cofactor cytidylyltransferase